VLPRLPLYASGKHPVPEVELKLGDALDEDLSRAGVVFAATTCWTEEALARLVASCKNAKSGMRLINMTRRLDLPKDKWVTVSTLRAQYGRGKMTFFVYKRI
ncbi:hypothetical protein T484DRAFT_1761016, partial [Baffinella frigidus]